MTTSSGFFWVLRGPRQNCDEHTYLQGAYMAERPLPPDGLRWLRIELKRSVAMSAESEVESVQRNIFDG